MSTGVGIRRWGRFVITILLLAALAPTVTRALRFAGLGSGPYGPVCSMQRGGDHSDGAMGAVDCPMCLVQAHGSLELPKVIDPAAMLPEYGAEHPWTFVEVQRERSLRLLALPRAPPTLS